MGGLTVLPTTRASHEVLIKTLWPDKAVYAAVMLFMTGLVGLLYGALVLMQAVSYSDSIPAVLRDYPAWLTLSLSVVTVAFGAVALRQKRLLWGFLGVGSGVAAAGGLGVGSLLSLVALVFLFLSMREGEDINPSTLKLTATMWPDKSLAASLLLLITGVMTLLWGVGIASELIVFKGYFDQPLVFGLGCVLVGFAALAAAYLLYYQRGAAIGVGAAIGAVLSMGFVLVAPILGLATLLLIRFAHREREFEAAGVAPA